MLKPLITKYKCIACRKNNITLAKYALKESPEEYLHNFWIGGTVFKLTIGYWSEHDCNMYFGAICDSCIKKFEKNNVLKYLGDYTIPTIEYHIKKIRYQYTKHNSINSILNNSEFKKLVKCGKMYVPAIARYINKSPLICCLLLSKIFKINLPTENIDELKDVWKKLLKISGYEHFVK